jgi:hypothetical protein
MDLSLIEPWSFALNLHGQHADREVGGTERTPLSNCSAGYGVRSARGP